MEEINPIGQRATEAAHETDRTSHDLIAKVYQRLRDGSAVQIRRQSSVQPGHGMADVTVQLQEAQP
jgi:hypothetical protein